MGGVYRTPGGTGVKDRLGVEPDETTNTYRPSFPVRSPSLDFGTRDTGTFEGSIIMYRHHIIIMTVINYNNITMILYVSVLYLCNISTLSNRNKMIHRSDMIRKRMRFGGVFIIDT